MVTLLGERGETRMIDRLVESDPLRWPLIKNAERARAYATKIEWLIKKEVTCESCGGTTTTTRDPEFNFMQIFRTPFSTSRLTLSKALGLHLDQIESALRDGRREIDFVCAHPLSRLGGVQQLLGRWPHKDDELLLKILRPTTLVNIDDGAVEWITELSLQARAGLL